MARSYARRTRRPRGTGRRARSARRRTGRRAPAVSVRQLATKVARISRIATQNIAFMKTTPAGGQVVTGPMANFLLFKPLSSLNQVFGASANYAAQNLMNFYKLKMKIHIDPGSEPQRVNFNMYVVSPRTQKVYEDTNEMTSFSEGRDYEVHDGMPFVNLKRFRVHKKWESLKTQWAGNSGTAVDHITHEIYRTCTIARRIPIKTHTSGLWTSVTDEELPMSSNLNLWVFNDNYSVDFENPLVKLHLLWSARCPR